MRFTVAFVRFSELRLTIRSTCSSSYDARLEFNLLPWWLACLLCVVDSVTEMSYAGAYFVSPLVKSVGNGALLTTCASSIRWSMQVEYYLAFSLCGLAIYCINYSWQLKIAHA